MKKRILWIDDERDLIEDGSFLLRNRGYDCDGVSDNESAVRLLGTGRPYDLIITDVARPPGMNMDPEEVEYGRKTGIFFCRRYIRTAHPDVPVLFFTVNPDPETHRQIRALGNCTIMNKPSTMEDLETAIRTLLSESREDLYTFRELDASSTRIIQVDFYSVNQELLKYLSQYPTAVYDLTPRRFEELIAKIFEDLDYEVLLTPKTRDGGTDLCAIKRNDLGELLYVVECKKFAPTRPVGIGHVRSLYGVKNATGASAGILVTTSFFTKPAKAFQQSLCYELSLRDYKSIKQWLKKYSYA